MQNDLKIQYDVLFSKKCIKIKWLNFIKKENNILYYPIGRYFSCFEQKLA